MSKTFVPIAARSAPIKMEGFIPWLRSNLFSSIGNSVVSLLVLALLVWAASGIAQWGIIHAVTAADPDACQAARGMVWCTATSSRRTSSRAAWPRQNSMSLQRRTRNSRRRCSAGNGQTRCLPERESRL